MKGRMAIQRSTVPSIQARLQTIASERAVDAVLEGSFPASDPPSWTFGITRPPPQRPATNAEGIVADGGRTALRRDDVIDLSRPAADRATFVATLMSWAGALAIVLIAPFVMLVLGLPVVLAFRGIVAAVSWLFAMLS